MVKVKVTNKIIKNFSNIICCGDGDLHYLLYFHDANYYNAGVYGWNYDAYIINYNTIIVSGYRTISHAIRTSWELREEYNEKAREIIKNHQLTYEQQRDQVEELLQEYCKKAIEGGV